MPRTVTTAFWEALSFSASDEDFVVLATISHQSISPPIRVVSDTVDLVSNGETFVGFPFEFVLPADTDSPPKGKIRIQNADKRIGTVVLALDTAVDMQLDVVLRSDPNTLQVSYRNLKLRNITGDAMAIEGEIGVQDYSTVPWPRVKATRALLPGLFP
jgi:hypothetical protein